MKRSGPPKRNTALKCKTKMGRGKRMQPRSTKRVTEQIERSARIRQAIEDGRTCELCPVLRAEGMNSGCDGTITELHERRKASAGGSRLNPQNTRLAGRLCNEFVEDHPRSVRERTGDALVVRPGDPEFDDLGVKAWNERMRLQ